MNEIVMLVRSKPFGEWVAAYYDSTKTDADKLLQCLTNRCKGSKRVGPVTGRLGDAEIAIMNPVLAPGDFLHVEAKLPEGSAVSASLTAPEGWTIPDGSTRSLKAGVTRWDVQLPRDAKDGTFSLVFERTDQVGDAKKLELKVDVVKWVKDR